MKDIKQDINVYKDTPAPLGLETHFLESKNYVAKVNFNNVHFFRQRVSQFNEIIGNKIYFKHVIKLLNRT